MYSSGPSDLERLIRYLYIQSQKTGGSIETAAALASGATTSSITTLNFTVNIGALGGNGSVGFLMIDFPCALQTVTMVADQVGYITVDVLKCQFPQLPATLSITGGDPLILTNTLALQKTNLAFWQVALQAGDILEFRASNIVSINRVSIGMKVVR